MNSLEAAIGPSPSARKRMAAVARGGKPALTHWRVCERFAYCTLLEVSLATGRTFIRSACTWPPPGTLSSATPPTAAEIPV